MAIGALGLLASGLGGAAIGGAAAGYIGVSAQIGAAVGYLAGVILYSVATNDKSGNRSRAIAAEFNAPTSSEGIPVPIVYGTQRVPLLISYYGDFKSVTTETSVGGGGSGAVTGGGAKQTQISYYLDWMGTLCFGPIDILHSIDINKKLIWDGPLDFSSGAISTLSAGDYGNLYFAWGIANQPVNGILAALQPDQTPRHHRIAYLSSDEWLLGASPSLQTITATVSRFPQTCIPNINTRVGDYDANPAAVIVDLLTHPYYGLRIPLAYIDLPAFKAAGELFQEEELGISLTVDQARSATSYIQDISLACSCFVYTAPNGKISIKTLRENNAIVCDQVIELDDADIIPATLQLTNTAENELVNHLEARYTSIADNFATRSFSTFNLANFQATGLKNKESVNLSILSNETNAAKAINRLMIERGTARASIRVEVNRRSAKPWIGRRVYLRPSSWGANEGIIGYITEIEESDQQSDTIRLTITQDKLAYIDDVSKYVPDSIDNPTVLVLLPFTRVQGIELPSGLNATSNKRVLVAAGQAPNTAISGFNVWMRNADVDGEYVFAGFRPRTVPAGDLLDPLTTTQDAISASQTIRVCLDGFNDDEVGSVSTALWEDNYTIMVVNDEMISVKTIAPIADTPSHRECDNAYEITGLRRGIYGTTQANHAVNDDVFFIRGILNDYFESDLFEGTNEDALCNLTEDELLALTEEELLGLPECVNLVLDIKAQPIGVYGETVDLADIDPVQLELSV